MEVETVICESCGKPTPLETAKMDDEDGNWFCPECLNDMKSECKILSLEEYNRREIYKRILNRK